MPTRLLEVTLWLLSGSILWLCAHTMTLIFPLPGPWLPIPAAVPTGAIMGLLGWALARSAHKILMPVTGLLTGSYLGWVFARGSLTGADSFAPATTSDRLLSVLVCGLLGLAANAGMLWMISLRDRPLVVFSILLSLLAVMFLAVFLIASFTFG